ncbi:Hypothetical predicted protein [Pelobates cultripes]|uniref:Uncharacterized protein n=1 Tax=Pelobates cultripes TaxID=61616 RepID=A0AAD1WT78_PELCU|nr:Hypothetical predicted protein [Pelobates cultripes]
MYAKHNTHPEHGSRDIGDFLIKRVLSGAPKMAVSVTESSLEDKSPLDALDNLKKWLAPLILGKRGQNLSHQAGYQVPIEGFTLSVPCRLIDNSGGHPLPYRQDQGDGGAGR